MKRKDFLKNGAVLLAIGPLISEACTKENESMMSSVASQNHDAIAEDCAETPSEVAGPFEQDLIKNSEIFRSDIREDRTGLVLNLRLQIVNINNNCIPVQNARVDIWHCDKDGYYSGFVNDGYLGTIDNTGKTFLRGIQLTNANGVVNFATVYPGWYPGRITHIHLEIFVNNNSVKTTQIAFPDILNKNIYESTYYLGHGQNTTVRRNIADPVFRDSLASELCTILKASPAGIKAQFQIGIEI